MPQIYCRECDKRFHIPDKDGNQLTQLLEYYSSEKCTSHAGLYRILETKSITTEEAILADILRNDMDAAQERLNLMSTQDKLKLGSAANKLQSLCLANL